MRMEEGGERPIEVRASEALGQGFDLSSDFRLKFAKGLDGSKGRLVVLNEESKRDIVIPSGSGGGVVIHGVPEDIHCDKGDRIRFKSDVLEFNQEEIGCWNFWTNWVESGVPQSGFNKIRAYEVLCLCGLHPARMLEF